MDRFTRRPPAWMRGALAFKLGSVILIVAFMALQQNHQALLSAAEVSASVSSYNHINEKYLESMTCLRDY